jgi:hypothetical protein
MKGKAFQNMLKFQGGIYETSPAACPAARDETLSSRQVTRVVLAVDCKLILMIIPVQAS